MTQKLALTAIATITLMVLILIVATLLAFGTMPAPCTYDAIAHGYCGAARP
jgi:hypothetical protein